MISYLVQQKDFGINNKRGSWRTIALYPTKKEANDFLKDLRSLNPAISKNFRLTVTK